MIPRGMLLLAFSATSTGCGGGSADIAPLRLIHSPPVNRLMPQQLKELSMECQKYPPHNSMRGRYDASYCEDAIAAWGDEPLQIVTIDQGASGAASGSHNSMPGGHTIP
jgi:hypothetical protein